MKLLSILICALFLTPILLISAGWIFPLVPQSAEIWAHIVDTVLWDYMRGTLILIFGVGIVCSMIGVPLAWIVSRFDFPFRRILSWSVILPFAVPGYILALVYGNIFEFAGPVQSYIRTLFNVGYGDYWFPQIRSLGGAIVVISLGSYAYVYLLARSAFDRQPAHWFEMSAVFGKSRAAQFWQMAFPAARPFILIGAALAVMEAAADLGVVDQFGVPTLATGVYRLFYLYDDPLVSARVTSMLLCLAGLLFVMERLFRKNARFSSTENKAQIARRPLNGAKGWLVSAVVATPILLGFIMPVLWLMRMTYFNPRPVHLSAVWSATADSLILATFGAFLVLVVSFVINISERSRVRPSAFVRTVVSIGYVIPGLAIALGLIMVQGFLRAEFNAPLIFTGSLLGLLMAYLIRFLSPAFSALNAGFLQIPPEFDWMAKSMGKTKWQIFTTVQFPLLRAPAFYAFTIVAIDIFKELPATLILRPFDVKTLAITIYEYAGDERPAEAAPYALTLVAVSLFAVYLLAKLQDKIDERTSTQ